MHLAPLSDLALACEKGLCFLDHQTPTEYPQKVEGLPEIPFTQVVCSELASSSDPTTTAITMFAISGRGELYFIEGKREWATGNLTLKSSGLPIRLNVTRVSCQYNAKLDSSELIYAGTGDAQINHLLRDPPTKCWSDDAIRFAVPKSMQKYRAFVTTLSIKSTAGRPLGGFSIEIQSQSAIVMINDRSYVVSNNATQVLTDDQGQIVVVAASMDSITAPYIHNRRHSQRSRPYGNCSCGQRVMNLLSQIKGDDGLMNAKTSTGKFVFSKSDVSGKEGDFKESAQFLTEFPTMVKAVDNSGGNDPGPEIAFSKGPPTMTASAKPAFSDMTNFLGDALEWIRTAIKDAFKTVFKVVAKGLKLIFTIAGKVISFVVKTIGPLIKAIGTFLKEKLGIDFGKLFDWLGLTWDNTKTKANQAVLKRSIHQILILPGNFLQANFVHLDGWFRRLEADLESLIGDQTPLNIGRAQDPNERLKNSPLALLLDNPIMNFMAKINLLSIIKEAQSEAFEEVLGDDFKFPNLGQFAKRAAEALSSIFSKEINVILDLFQKLWTRIENVAKDPLKVLENLKGAFQDIARALFDTVENVVKGVWQFITEMFGLIVEFIEGVWKIPLITDFFEWFTDHEFSVLNAVTYVIVRIFGLIVGEDNVAQYLDFEDLGEELNQTAKVTNIFSSCQPNLAWHLTSLQWRGFFGAALSLPFVVTVPINGFIAEAFVDNWRWGLGMFAIIVPIMLLPAIFTLYSMQRRGEEKGMVTMAASKRVRTGIVCDFETSPSSRGVKYWMRLMYQGLVDIDIVGLMILAVSFALILLPFTLAARARGGWTNGGIIAMLVLGFVLLVVFVLWEAFIASRPVMTQHILKNRTFLAAVNIYTFNQMASALRNTYFSSYIYVIKEWSTYEWTIFLGITTMGVSLLGPIVGLIQRRTH